MPVVSEDGVLIGNLSVRDVRAVLTNKRAFKALQKSVTEFIASYAPDKGRVAVAASIVMSSFALVGLERSEMFPAITCKATATLGEILTKLAISRIHRVYIVDPKGRPMRAVTLSDVLAALVTPNAN